MLMKDLVALLLASVASIRAQAVIASNNYGVPYNGIGAIPAILAREAHFPMRRRVLMALLVRYFPDKYRESIYEAMTVVGLFLALLTMNSCYGMNAALLLAAFLPLTYRFDYWDWIPEVGAAIAATSGRIDLVYPWTIAAALSRETAPIIPIIWLCYVGDIKTCVYLSAVIAVVTLGVIQWQGTRPFLGGRIQAAGNGHQLAWWLENVGRTILMRSDQTSTNIITAACVIVCVNLGFPRALPWLCMLTAGWLWAVAVETRVFTICLIPVVLWLCGFT